MFKNETQVSRLFHQKTTWIHVSMFAGGAPGPGPLVVSQGPRGPWLSVRGPGALWLLIRSPAAPGLLSSSPGVPGRQLRTPCSSVRDPLFVS